MADLLRRRPRAVFRGSLQPLPKFAESRFKLDEFRTADYRVVPGAEVGEWLKAPDPKVARGSERCTPAGSPRTTG